ERQLEVVGVLMAAELRQAVEIGADLRQGLGLLVLDHLQAMLDVPEIAIGLAEIVGDIALGAAERDQALQGVEGRLGAEIGIAAAPDQLLGLGEEFDLADAAAAELDVMAGDRDVAKALHRMDLALDRMDVLDRIEVEMLAPDEGAKLEQELLPRLLVAGGD